jgi:hypothetical protein
VLGALGVLAVGVLASVLGGGAMNMLAPFRYSRPSAPTPAVVARGVIGLLALIHCDDPGRWTPGERASHEEALGLWRAAERAAAEDRNQLVELENLMRIEAKNTLVSDAILERFFDEVRGPQNGPR